MSTASILGLLLLLAMPLSAGAGEGEPSTNLEFAVEIVPTDADPAVCPAVPQVAEAVLARMPNLIRGDAGQSSTTLLRLKVWQIGPVSIRLELANRNGVVVLERALESGPRGAGPRQRAAADCAALSDTVALIVERYLREIGYRGQALVIPAPSAPVEQRRPASQAAAPPPASASVPPTLAIPATPAAVLTDERWTFIGAGASLSAPVRVRGLGGDSQSTGYLELGGDLVLRRLVFSASAGLGEATQTPPLLVAGGGTFRLMPMPVRLGVGLRVPVGPGSLVPCVGAGVDILWISTNGVAGASPRVAFEPVVDIGASYLLPLGRRAYFKVQVASVLDLRPRDFALDGTDPSPIVFRSARMYLRGGVAFGIALGPS